MNKLTRRGNILLFGMKHSGKTTLGRRLANHLGVEFADLDEVIERLFDPDRTSSCREIYRSRGKEFFVALETKAAGELAGRMEREHIVAALGGGTIENLEAMALLNESGLKVYLRDAPSVLFERIMRTGLPAFLDPDNPRRAFDSLYERRTALFEREADIVVDIDGQGLDEAFSSLLAQVERAREKFRTRH